MSKTIINNLPFLEQKGDLPKYKPGDLIVTKKGNIGIITDAHTNVGGIPIQWNDLDTYVKKINKSKSSSWMPCYSVQFFKLYAGEKAAWWESSEWLAVSLGPFHNLNRDNI